MGSKEINEENFLHVLLAAEKASEILDNAEKSFNSEEIFLGFLYHFCATCIIKSAIYLDKIGCDPSITKLLELVKEQSIYYFKSGAHDFDVENGLDMVETEEYERFY